MQARFVIPLSEIRATDHAQVGGKIANMGELCALTYQPGVLVPDGFAVAVAAYDALLDACQIREAITTMAQDVRTSAAERSRSIQELIMRTALPDDVVQAIARAYDQLADGDPVAVRSSATAEDLPTASFAGQQDSFLYVIGRDAVVHAVQACMASLFTERAILYREEHRISHASVRIAVLVQRMVVLDEHGVSGVIFTLEPESGCHNAIVVSASYGLGESIVQGEVNPDVWWLLKQPRALSGELSIVQRACGTKQRMTLPDKQGGVRSVSIVESRQQAWSLADAIVRKLAEAALMIEEAFARRTGDRVAMDIEWAYDGTWVYIVQARPETVHGSARMSDTLVSYRLRPEGKSLQTLAQGQAIGTAIVTGIARHVASPSEDIHLSSQDIIVTSTTDPQWMRLLRQAGGIVTDQGGRTCHAAIVSRELGKPAVVGTRSGTATIPDGAPITIDCSGGTAGVVYAGALACDAIRMAIPRDDVLTNRIMINIAQPESAWAASQLPVAGVGLLRLEFLLSTQVGFHPMAVHRWAELTEVERAEILEKSAGFATPAAYLRAMLVDGISTIAGAFYPRPVLVRCTDFKSNEYRSLLGGAHFEPAEENPMLGWRGAGRYGHADYRAAFALECAALREVRQERKLDNVHCMIPFVRSVAEAHVVAEILQSEDLARSATLQWYMMVETPANVLGLAEYTSLFDGFSIGSNDLTQLTLGIDRDNPLVVAGYSESDPAVWQLIRTAITTAHAHGATISLCGEAPSHDTAYARQLLHDGIDTISVAASSVAPLLRDLLQKQD